MADNTNMDLNRPSKEDGPQLEFTLPIFEVGQDLQVGQKGDVTVPVEVTQVVNGIASFRKRGTASGANFRQQSLQDLEDELPVAER